MASLPVKLANIPQGWYMAWSMATQAAGNICVTLADSVQTYVPNVCQQSTEFKVMSQGYAQVQGQKLTLTITANVELSAMKVMTYPVTIALPDGSNVGQGYNVVFEDHIDNDYNDLFVTIMAWEAHG